MADIGLVEAALTALGDCPDADWCRAGWLRMPRRVEVRKAGDR